MDREILAFLILLGILVVALILARDKKPSEPIEDEEDDDSREEDAESNSNPDFPITKIITTNGYHVGIVGVKLDGDFQVWIKVGNGAFCIGEEQRDRFSGFLDAINAALNANVGPLNVRTIDDAIPMALIAGEDDMLRIWQIGNWTVTLPKEDFEEIIQLLNGIREAPSHQF